MFSNMFWIRWEGSVYFNIWGKECVIQASLKEIECNLLLIFFTFQDFDHKLLVIFIRNIDQILNVLLLNSIFIIIYREREY